MQKALSYLRVSGKGQVDGDGFPRQRDRISKWAKAHKYQVVDEYRDEGVSGTKAAESRPGMAAMLDRLESNGVKVVLVENASRLARDLIIQEIILSQVRAMGIQVFEVDGGNDLTTDGNEDPTAALTRQILGAIAQFEKTTTVLKLRAARDRKSKKAGKRVEGRKPFGVNPGEAATLKRMKELRRKPRGGARLSYSAIALQLTFDRLPTRSGKPWSRQMVERILNREGLTDRSELDQQVERDFAGEKAKERIARVTAKAGK